MNLNISPEILSLIPYKPGQSEDQVKKQYQRDFFVKLASNECPLGPSSKVRDALVKASESIELYPDPGCERLRSVAAGYYDIDAKNILVGNGSNELIDLLIRVLCAPGDYIVASAVSFIAYKICAQAARVVTKEIPLKSGYQIDLQEISRFLETQEKLPKLVFIPNPNNPTGTLIPAHELKEFMDKWGGHKEMLVVIDEAYNEFVTSDEFLPASEFLKHENVIVLKTMSKVFGLAGLRLGFMLGNSEVLDLVHRIRNPFNVNSLAQAAGCAALEDADHLAHIKDVITKGREDLENFFKQNEITYAPSQGNFVLFDTSMDSHVAHDLFLKAGLILRPLKPYKLDSEMRITIGSKEQMDFAKRALGEVLSLEGKQ